MQYYYNRLEECPTNLEQVVKVSELPDPYDNPEDVGGYVLDVSDIDLELIKALSDKAKSEGNISESKIVIEYATKHTATPASIKIQSTVCPICNE